MLHVSRSDFIESAFEFHVFVVFGVGSFPSLVLFCLLALLVFGLRPPGFSLRRVFALIVLGLLLRSLKNSRYYLGLGMRL